jgi:hypothetical protein
MPRWIPGAVLLAAAAVPAGCSFQKVELNDPSIAHKARNIVLGETREEQLLEILGVEPTSFITLKEGGRLLNYAYGLSKTGGLNLIVFNTQKTNSGLDTMFLKISPEGVVTKAWIGDHSSDVEWDWWAFGD